MKQSTHSQWSCIPFKKCTDIKVIAFGNALVSYTAYLEDTKLLDRYKLSMNTKCEIDVETLSEVTAEVIVNKEQHEPKLGGSAMNTVCILKSLGTKALFFGACGDDDQSKIMFELLKNANMDRYCFKLQTIPDTSTGRRISLVHKDSKSLYTNNGASVKFTGSYLQQVENEENSSFLRPLNRKQIFYIEGFFVPKCEAVTTFIVRHYLKGRRYLALNLSADYIVRINFPHMLFLANNSLFIFGNRAEFEVFRECWGASCIKELAIGLAKESKVPKILVITNGAGVVEMITNYVPGKSTPGNITYCTFHVTPVENITDTTGCGDVFVAAFLHEWLNKSSLSHCALVASCLASKSIQKNGRCSYHETSIGV
ncbi:adenosine kinase-like [Calliphora vicina]|uniref:adenosine kinase-like n=1 Tax=Calliphora vicina TaxID=7373 RepID=UPI00325AA300